MNFNISKISSTGGCEYSLNGMALIETIRLVIQTPERYVWPHFTEKRLHGNRV